MGDWSYNIKNYFRLNTDELTSLLLGSLFLGFGFAFKDFSLLSFVFAFLIALASLFFHVSMQKIFALSQGYYVEYRLWWYGLLIGLVFVFVSNGNIWWVMLPGGVIFTMIARQRIGKFRYGLNWWPMGWIAVSGPFASIAFGTLFKNIELYIIGSSVPLFSNIFMFNLVLAAAAMIPFPPLDGHYMFYASRPWFVILFGTIFVYTVLTLVFNFYSWIWAIIAGLVIWIVYYLKFESGAWF